MIQREIAVKLCRNILYGKLLLLSHPILPEFVTAFMSGLNDGKNASNSECVPVIAVTAGKILSLFVLILW